MKEYWIVSVHHTVGGPASDRIRGEKFSEGELRSVLCNMAMGLEYIHSKQLIHLNIYHPRLCHGAVASVAVDDSLRIAVSLNSDWDENN